MMHSTTQEHGRLIGKREKRATGKEKRSDSVPTPEKAGSRDLSRIFTRRVLRRLWKNHVGGIRLTWRRYRRMTNYLSHFGLREAPFARNQHPKWIYLSP